MGPSQAWEVNTLLCCGRFSATLQTCARQKEDGKALWMEGKVQKFIRKALPYCKWCYDYFEIAITLRFLKVFVHMGHFLFSVEYLVFPLRV